jgi:hypothetical protein
MKSILGAFLFFICFNAYSQIDYAGHNLSVYVDINPDTLINAYCTASWTNSTESYYLDVNGDSQNDFQIKAYCNIGSVASSSLITITSLNSSSYIRLGRIDSVYNAYYTWWWVDIVAQPLLYGDSINSLAAKWDNSNLYLIDNSYMTGCSHIVNDWKSSTDKYIGIKYQNTTDTIYGWIRVNCPNSSNCYVRDYSLEGGAPLNINEFGIGHINVYPNPSSDKVCIERTNVDAMDMYMYDIVGKQVCSAIKTTNAKIEIDVSHFQEGIYFLSIKTAKGMITRKIIVQR